MPTYTQTAFAAELAAERCDAIAAMHRLITSLEGHTPAVIAGALAGMTAEAQAERDRLRAETVAEQRAKDEKPKPKRSRRAAAPATPAPVLGEPGASEAS